MDSNDDAKNVGVDAYDTLQQKISLELVSEGGCICRGGHWSSAAAVQIRTNGRAMLAPTISNDFNLMTLGFCMIKCSPYRL